MLAARLDLSSAGGMGEENREYISGREWIIDGNHHETLEMRVEAADLILFLILTDCCAFIACGSVTGIKGLISRIIWMKRRIRLLAVPGMGMEIPGKMPARYPEYTKKSS